MAQWFRVLVLLAEDMADMAFIPNTHTVAQNCL